MLLRNIQYPIINNHLILKYLIKNNSTLLPTKWRIKFLNSQIPIFLNLIIENSLKIKNLKFEILFKVLPNFYPPLRLLSREHLMSKLFPLFP
jgi:hypothetical protein